MAQRAVRVATFHFWEGFRTEQLNARFPCLSRKYRIVSDPERPEVVFFSVFHAGRFDRMPARPVPGVPAVFITGENVKPDMSRCDFAISFRRDIDSPRHMRIPNWVHRLNAAGISPRKLLAAERLLGAAGDRFCLFIHRSRASLREEFFRVLSRRMPVDAPGRSQNNMAPIGSELCDKLALQRRYRFTIAFENAATPGYTTEKLAESLLTGSLPIYWGDPLVGLDFNQDAFLNLTDFESMEELADAVMALEGDPAAWRRRRDQPAYVGDRVPDCADEDRIFAFFESVFDSISASPGQSRPRLVRAVADRLLSVTRIGPRLGQSRRGGLERRVASDFARHRKDTSVIGFHGDLHLLRTIAGTLNHATVFVETGANRGVSLAYAASLRPDIPMRSCEASPSALAEARERCVSFPNVRISATPSPDALLEMLEEFRCGDHRPVFWLDAHAQGVPLPLGGEIKVITGAFPRAYVFIDDFQVPGRPWFSFDSYPEGTLCIDYLKGYLDRRWSYRLTLPRYNKRTSTHHPLRGWCCLSWGDVPAIADARVYETRVI